MIKPANSSLVPSGPGLRPDCTFVFFACLFCYPCIFCRLRLEGHLYIVRVLNWYFGVEFCSSWYYSVRENASRDGLPQLSLLLPFEMELCDDMILWGMYQVKIVAGACLEFSVEMLLDVVCDRRLDINEPNC